MQFAIKDKTPIVLFLFVFMINLVVVIRMPPLIYTSDDFSVAAMASLLTGKDWSASIDAGGYYGYGQALWYAPLFLLFKDPYVLYKAITTANTLVVGCISIVVYDLVKNFLKVPKKINCVIISLICCLYPSYQIFSKLLHNETTLALVTWLVVYLACKAYEHSLHGQTSKSISSLLGFVLIYGYAIHGRAIGFIPAVFLTILLFYFFTKKVFLNLKYLLISMSGCFIVDVFMKKFFIQNLWQGQSENIMRNTATNTISKIVDRLDIEHLLGLIDGAIGHVYYVGSASMGIFLLSLTACVFFFVSYRKKYAEKEEIINEKVLMVTILTCIMFFIALSISLLFIIEGLINPSKKGDVFLYGRYIENTVPPLMLSGIAIIHLKKVKFSHILAASVGFYTLASIYVLVFIQSKMLNRPTIAVLPITGIVPYANAVFKSINSWIIEMWRIDCIQLSLIVIFVMLAIGIIYVIMDNFAVFGLVTFLYLYSFAFVAINLLMPYADSTYPAMIIAQNTLRELGDLYKQYNKLCLVAPGASWKLPKLYQYALPDYKVMPCNQGIQGMADSEEDNCIVIFKDDVYISDRLDNFHQILPGQLESADLVYVHGREINEYFNNDLHIQTTEPGVYIINLKEVALLNSAEAMQDPVSDGSDESTVFSAVGRFMTMSEGDYTATVELELKNGLDKDALDDILGAVYIVADWDMVLMNKVDINKSFFDDTSNYEIQIPFRLLQETKYVQLRMLTNNNVNLEIKSASINIE